MTAAVPRSHSSVRGERRENPAASFRLSSCCWLAESAGSGAAGAAVWRAPVARRSPAVCRELGEDVPLVGSCSPAMAPGHLLLLDATPEAASPRIFGVVPRDCGERRRSCLLNQGSNSCRGADRWWWEWRVARACRGGGLRRRGECGGVNQPSCCGYAAAGLSPPCLRRSFHAIAPSPYADADLQHKRKSARSLAFAYVAASAHSRSSRGLIAATDFASSGCVLSSGAHLCPRSPKRTLVRRRHRPPPPSSLSREQHCCLVTGTGRELSFGASNLATLRKIPVDSDPSSAEAGMAFAVVGPPPLR